MRPHLVTSGGRAPGKLAGEPDTASPRPPRTPWPCVCICKAHRCGVCALQYMPDECRAAQPVGLSTGGACMYCRSLTSRCDAASVWFQGRRREIPVGVVRQADRPVRLHHYTHAAMVTAMAHCGGCTVCVCTCGWGNLAAASTEGACGACRSCRRGACSRARVLSRRHTPNWEVFRMISPLLATAKAAECENVLRHPASPGHGPRHFGPLVAELLTLGLHSAAKRPLPVPSWDSVSVSSGWFGPGSQ